MGLGSWTRRTGFWAWDGLNGSPVRHHYDDIRAKMAGQGDADEQLGRLLEHATRTTSFYAPLAGRGLADFPVIDRAFCRQHIGELSSSAFTDGQLRSVSTSGSTGTPLTVHQDRSKRQRTVADLIYVHEAAGLALGEKLMWIHEWSSVTAKSRLGALLQNVVSVRQATLDGRGEDEVIDRLRRDRVRGLLAYGSELWSLARRVEDHHPDLVGGFELSVVLSHADDLAPGTRARIRAAFGAPVVDRYSNSENGILAWTGRDEDDFQLNRASFRFELLRLDSDEPTAPGELARVVLTHLYNLATPLIRYDTGDLAVVGDRGPGGPTTIRRLEGRRSNLVSDSQGQRVSPGTVIFVMNGFHDLLEWQFIQERPGSYRVLVTIRDARRDPDELVAALRTVLGADARVSVEPVERIPRRANQKYQAIIVEDGPTSGASPGGATTG
jgi:phenylacetate-CoA ligase